MNYVRIIYFMLEKISPRMIVITDLWLLKLKFIQLIKIKNVFLKKLKIETNQLILCFISKCLIVELLCLINSNFYYIYIINLLETKKNFILIPMNIKRRNFQLVNKELVK